MRLDDFIKVVEKIAPLELQEDWDNSGVQVRATSGEINKVLVAMEINDSVIDEAIGAGVELILTHHPLLFFGIKKVDNNDITGNHIIKLVRRGISVYSSHTPFDKCIGGNNDYLGKLLGFEDVGPLPGDESSICRMGSLSRPMSCGALVNHASLALNLPKDFIKFAGRTDDIIEKAAWCTGAGAEYLDLAVNAGCDLYITGDVKYHEAQHARDLGMNLLDLGHFGTEYLFARNMSEILRRMPELYGVDIIESRVNLNPFTEV